MSDGFNSDMDANSQESYLGMFVPNKKIAFFQMLAYEVLPGLMTVAGLTSLIVHILQIN